MAEMYFEKEWITKDKADMYLQNNPKNRTIKRKVERIKNDLLHGNFELTHQPIAVSEDGELIDGQHRLVAISETGVPTWLFVCHNAVKSAKIDRGSSRNDRESLYMAGMIEKGTVAWCNLTLPLVTFIIGRNIGRASCDITETEKLNVYNKLHDIIDPCIKIVQAHSQSYSKTRAAAVIYSMMCALNAGVNEQKLKKWYQILASGDFYSEDHDELIAGRGILILRNILNTGVIHSMGHPSTYDEILGKIMASIYHFSRNEEVKQIKGKMFFKDIRITEDDLYRR